MNDKVNELFKLEAYYMCVPDNVGGLSCHRVLKVLCYNLYHRISQGLLIISLAGWQGYYEVNILIDCG